MIREGLMTYLLAQSAITALVGQRIRPVMVPQSDVVNGSTGICVRRMPKAGAHSHTLTAALGEDFPRFRFDCYAATLDGAVDIAEALRGELQGYRGAMGSDTVTSVVLEDEYDDYIQPVDGSEKGLFVVVLEYDIQVGESIPTFL